LLEEAIKLTGLFITEGPVVQERDADGPPRVDEDKDASVLYDGPMIVLTSRFSASASEILAGALQDYGRALLIGDSSTHGKGTVQGVNPLKHFFQPGTYTATNDPGALKITVRKFYRASGASTQLKGVVPDIILPSPNNVLEVGEAALDNPLLWDTIPSATFERLNRVEPYLAELRKRSTERVNTEKDFDYIREDMELVKKQQDDKSVSLNEQQRLKEKEENDARGKAREKERLARKNPEPKVYDLTLKLADQPGLPPPTVKTNAVIAKSVKSPTNTVAAKSPAATTIVPTHSAAVAASAMPALKSGDPDSADDEEKAPAIDVTLEETEHILVDYLSVLAKDPVAPLAVDSAGLKKTDSPRPSVAQ
jgi:carboxyl-terminal processing protease